MIRSLSILDNQIIQNIIALVSLDLDNVTPPPRPSTIQNSHSFKFLKSHRSRGGATESIRMHGGGRSWSIRACLGLRECRWGPDLAPTAHSLDAYFGYCCCCIDKLRCDQVSRHNWRCRLSLLVRIRSLIIVRMPGVAIQHSRLTISTGVLRSPYKTNIPALTSTCSFPK
jgi:hypothetical protein